MTDLLVLSEAEVDQVLDRPLLRAALERVFVEISRSAVDVPDRIAASSPEGTLLAMPGFVPDVGFATKLVTLFPGNDSAGLPTHQGILTLFDSHSGTPVAVMGAERLTQLRTAMSAWIAADLMADQHASILTIIGAGAQAAGHLEAFRTVRAWEEIRIWNRTPRRAELLAAGSSDTHSVPEIEASLEGADVVLLCTHTDEPLFDLRALARGAHVSSVGIGRELPSGLVETSVVAVELRAFADTPPPAGALDLLGCQPKQLFELGELIAGSVEFERDSDHFTIYKSVGHAAEDCAAAKVAFDVALSKNVGRLVAL